MWNRMLSAACAVMCMTGASFAADLEIEATPDRPRPVYHKRYDWTGLYFGVHAGYGFGRGTSRTEFTGGLLDGVGVSDAADLRGGLYGLQGGFNWQLGWLVFGGEVDGMWMSGHESTNTIACGANCSANTLMDLKAIATARGRIGVAFDRVWVYATGGVAFVIASETLTQTFVGITATLPVFSHGKTGWVAGLGAEWAFWEHWSARFEYLYIDAQGTNNTNTVPAALVLIGNSTVIETARYRENVLRAAVNYRFGP